MPRRPTPSTPEPGAPEPGTLAFPVRVPVAMGGNPGRSRSHNRRVVLELLRRNGPSGCKALADLAQISTQAVANIIDDLLAENLLVDQGRRRNGRGLPPIQYAINPDGAITVGFEIAVGEVMMAVLDLGGNVRETAVLEVDAITPAAVLPRIAAAVGDICARHQAPLMGIGVVMPGPFEQIGPGSVGSTALADWAGVDVVAHLSDLTGAPVFLDNDANAAAVAEMMFPNGHNVSNLCLIYFGAGTGLGAIVRDQPLRGAFGNAGEIGHVVVVPGGRPCQCGQSGCLERHASRQALAEVLALRGLDAGPETVLRLLAQDDAGLAAWMHEAAQHLATVVGLLENIFDPETVILGGKMPGAVLDRIIAQMRLPPSVASRRDHGLPRVIRGATGRASAALGAAALPSFDAITPRLDVAALPQSGPAATVGGSA